MIELHPIRYIESDVWDQAISGFESKLLFHQSAWLRFLAETQNGKILKFAILDDGKIEGYFAGLLVRKGGFNILGSPLIGWKTDHMGPIVNQDLDIAGFLKALDKTCREIKVHLVQLANPHLDPRLMLRMGYDKDGWMVFVVPLARDEESMWKAVSSKCRNRIRKGIKNRLEVEEWNEAGFVEEHYSQLVEVFARQKSRPYYSFQMVRNLVRNLSPGNLLSLRVKSEGTTIATGLFVYDERHAYSFGSASRTEFQKLYPNELLFWTAMKRLAKEGKEDFCIGTNYRIPEKGGMFKEKFNGHPEPVFRHTKSFSLLASAGREFHKYSYRAKEFLGRSLNVPR